MEPVERKVDGLVWDLTVDFPGGFYCVTSDSPVSERREMFKVKSSSLIKE